MGWDGGVKQLGESRRGSGDGGMGVVVVGSWPGSKLPDLGSQL